MGDLNISFSSFQIFYNNNTLILGKTSSNGYTYRETFQLAPCCHPVRMCGPHTAHLHVAAEAVSTSLTTSTSALHITSYRTRHSTDRTMLPWRINLFSVPLVLTYLSNWLWFHFLVLPLAPSTASSTEAFNICWLLRMKLFYILLGSQKTSMAVISWVPAASWLKSCHHTFSCKSHMSRAEKRPNGKV